MNWFRVIRRLSWFHTKGFPTLVVPFCGTTRVGVWTDEVNPCASAKSVAALFCRAALDRTAEGGCPHVVHPKMSEVRRPLLQDAVIQFLFSPVGGGLHEGQHQGVRLSGLGGKLRLEQGGDIKTVGG